MRVLILASEFPPGPGGIGTHAYEIAKHLQRLGWQVTVVARQDYQRNDDIRRFNEAQVFRIVTLEAVPTLLLEFIYRLCVTLAYLIQTQPDAVIATGRHSTWVAALIRRFYQKSLIAVAHGTEFTIGSALERKLTYWAFQSATAVVPVSEYTLKQMLECGVRPHQARVIPNGADNESFKVMRTSNGHQTMRLLTVGHVSERKGHDIVIRALPQLVQQYPKLEYEIIGLPTRKDELQALADQLQVQDHVRFLGQVDRKTLVQHLNQCDVFVMTSRRTAAGGVEGYGIAVVEAALCAKPAVVTGNSGLAEAVIDGKTGYIVPENDPQATADSVRRLLDDESLRLSMGQAARERALREQTWAVRASEYHALLLELCATQQEGQLA